MFEILFTTLFFGIPLCICLWHGIEIVSPRTYTRDQNGRFTQHGSIVHRVSMRANKKPGRTSQQRESGRSNRPSSIFISRSIPVMEGNNRIGYITLKGTYGQT